MTEGEYVDLLISEYTTLLRSQTSNDQHNRQDETGIIAEMAASADWSARGAREIMRLADEYGAFMLRNALAIAAVLGKEDGSRGY